MRIMNTKQFFGCLILCLHCTLTVTADEIQKKPIVSALVPVITEDQSVKVVAAAKALLERLSETERTNTLFKFNDEDQRLRWSNLPSGIFERKGLRMGDLIDAVMNLLKLTLSTDGYQQVVENMAGEETLNAGGRRGRVIFGKDEFYFSILGIPSLTDPWMWQFGGHHLAINATIVRDQITLGPSLTGGQPMHYSKDNKEFVQMAEEIKIAFELVNSLDDVQKRKTVLSDRFTDMILGPGHDDVRPELEGISARDLTEAQAMTLKRLIAERVGLLNEEDTKVRMDAIEAQLSESHFSWRGPTKSGSAAYYRVQGPTYFLEYAPQQMGGDPNEHIHAMYREFGNDYGEQWVKEK
ncbi:MAG: DUF3500 domain-containing protein [Planctomycetota bacterium]|nr:DUF3500 domain-containing protein [Planctomycetota bacterium]